MRYVSTRNTAKTYDFKDVFIKGLADDGGLFIPSSLPKYSEKEIQELRSLNYSDLAKKIIFPFIGNFMDKDELSKIIDKSYSCLLYTSPSPRDKRQSRMPSSA